MIKWLVIIKHTFKVRVQKLTILKNIYLIYYQDLLQYFVTVWDFLLTFLFSMQSEDFILIFLLFNVVRGIYILEFVEAVRGQLNILGDKFHDSIVVFFTPCTRRKILTPDVHFILETVTIYPREWVQNAPIPRELLTQDIRLQIIE